jgi:hypothetical protein
MNELIAHWRQMLSAHVERDLAWTQQSRRGRWMVIEPELSHLCDLRDLPTSVRATIDAAVERRGRRFSSLSRARAFARSVGGRVERRGRRRWRNVSPWERASRCLDAPLLTHAYVRRLDEVAP